MLDPWRVFFQELIQNFRIADFFDIALISVFFYTTISWFKETTSRLTLMGLLFFTLVYFLARTFDLYLTSMVFQGVFAVALVALVVVFQEEIRRTFERIAIWGSFQERRAAVTSFSGVDTIVETVSNLAENKVGALIVLRGKEPLDRHVSGGIPLHGRLSSPLLQSIFDPHSPGHDGAVAIEGDRITKFSVHLPLSKNLHEIRQLGTRHTAALGLSELTDALIVVVSEEQGIIRVAERGKLTKIESAAQLKGRLEDFYKHRFPADTQNTLERFLRQDIRIKLLSVGLACLSWVIFAYQAETIQRSFVVPIEYRNLPAGWLLEEPKPVEAQVILTGSERAFRLLNPNSLMISLDLNNIREGTQRLPILERNLNPPSALSIYRIEPNILVLEAHEVTLADLPVEVQTEGKLGLGLRLGKVKAIPAVIRAAVWTSKGDRIKKVETEPIDLEEITQTQMFRVKLILPPEIHLAGTQPPEVRVTIEVHEEKS